MNEWDVLEKEFKKLFIDYTEHERAQDKIWKLRMTQGNIDKYVAAFELLGHCAGMDLDNPLAIQIFARGLPHCLANACIDNENPSTFKQWTLATQSQHRNFLRKQEIHSDYSTPMCTMGPPKPGQFFWNCSNATTTMGNQKS